MLYFIKYVVMVQNVRHVLQALGINIDGITLYKPTMRRILSTRLCPGIVVVGITHERCSRSYVEYMRKCKCTQIVDISKSI